MVFFGDHILFSYITYMKQPKVILNMFICEHQSPKWEECVDLLLPFKFPTSVGISKGHNIGLSLQVLLDYKSIDEAKGILNKLLNYFPITPLIVVSEVYIELKNIPIGWYNDSSLINPGRYFDKLVKNNKKGLFIL